ncbi:NlpC/P60 family protein [Corynebacterium gerontici]
MTPTVHADEVDALIAQMDQISHDTNAKNEEVKQLQNELDAGNQKLDDLQRQAQVATDEANAALAQEQGLRSEVNRLAGAKYRGATIDPITNALGADSPQYAIDRAAYMGTLTRNAKQSLQDLHSVTEVAAEKRSEAKRTIAEVSFEQNELKRQQADLKKQQEELEARTQEVLDRVNGLSADQRARWIAKNGPVDVDPVVFSSVASEAVQAALSKLGAPYEWGAAGPDAFDCSGLVVWAYQQQGKQLPRTSQAQMAGGTPVSRGELQPGDVVGYYPGATHVGIYIGDGKLVHASDYGIPVQVVPVDSMPIYGARRY